MFILLAHHFPCRGRTTTTFREAALLVISNARRIFDCQRSDFFAAEDVENRCPVEGRKTTFDFFVVPTNRSLTVTAHKSLQLETKLTAQNKAYSLKTLGGPG